MKRIEYASGDSIGKCVFEKELPRLIQPSGQPKRMGRFLCACGNIFDATIDNVKRGHTTSCGCEQKLATSRAKKTHGGSTSMLYSRWCSMKQRCYDENSTTYMNYGNIGIDICDEWRNSFEAFEKWSIDNGFRNNLEIDRIDNYKGYSPLNCRWINKSGNNQNIRHKTGGTSKYIGVSKTRHNRYLARISKDKIEYYIGIFLTEEEAAIAVNKKIDELNSFHTKNQMSPFSF